MWSSGAYGSVSATLSSRGVGAVERAPAAPRPALRNVSNGGSANGGNKGAPSAAPPPSSRLAGSMRVTRLAAARQRQADHLGDQQQGKKGKRAALAPAEEAMAVDSEGSEGRRARPCALQCAHIAHDIFAYLRLRELRHRVPPHFLASQHDINATMRGILVDWLVEVGEEYKLQRETLHLCVNYIDRFLTHVPVARSKLQLVGVGCMIVAAKYEDVSPPTVDDLVYISDNTYTRDEILAMEGAVLQRLNFDLSAVTSIAFLPRFCTPLLAADATALCFYLCELTLPEVGFVQFIPSEVAAASIHLALHTLRLPSWSADLEAVTGYSRARLAGCASALYDLHRTADVAALQAVREKYSSRRFFGVSTLQPAPSSPVAA